MYRISISPEEIEKYELAAFPGEIQVIDSEDAAFRSAISFLRRQKVLGFDTETRPVFSPDQPRHSVALLQLSGPGKAFLFRVQKLGLPQSLRDILSNGDILKIGAAVGDDVRGLQRLHDFEAGGFVDLQKMVWQYGIRDKSVKKMSAIILRVRISKTQQLSNWEAEVLSEPQCRYAATDAWVCREMYFRLKRSKQHPLTPEQLNPQQKAAPAADASGPSNSSTPSAQGTSGRKRHRGGRRHRKKAALKGSGQTAAPAAAASNPSTPSAPGTSGRKRRRGGRHRHRRRRKTKTTSGNDRNIS
ncbi:MAG: 3'-5' exonuclease [Bacteroidia bacterium]|nr:3'-5' exonuclease [Bacteroidia bacterium]